MSKKIFTFGFLLSICLGTMIAASVSFPYIIEGEDMVDSKGEKAKVLTDVYGQEFPGYSGKGFIYLAGNELSFEVEIDKDAIFTMTVVATQTVTEEKTVPQIISVNGIEKRSELVYSDKWKNYDFGLIRLNEGKNKITFTNRWGYFAIDKIILDYPVFPDFKESDSVPCDPKATKEAKTLMAYLHKIYGEHILSGQQEIYGGGHDGDYEFEMNYLEKLTGKLPAIRAFDIANYNNMFGWDDGCWDRAIDWWENKGGILSACYHITLPTDWDNYKVGTPIEWSPSAVTYKPLKAFKVAKATTKGTKENDWLNANIKIIAEKFLEMQERGIPIIWRPFHEAEGNPGIGNAWFWWGQEGPEPFKALWIYLYKELTETYGVHNLLWELNLYCWNEDSALWYPGDKYVDIIGYDKYNVVYNRHDGKTSGPNEDAESNLFYGLLNMVKNKKMVSMPENDTVPSLKNMVVENVPWLYFCIWYDGGSDGDFVTGKNFQNADTLKELYQSDFCITLDELPDLKNGEIE